MEVVTQKVNRGFIKYQMVKQEAILITYSLGGADWMARKAFPAEGSAAWGEAAHRARRVSTLESLQDSSKQSSSGAGDDPPLVGNWTRDLQRSHSQHF